MNVNKNISYTLKLIFFLAVFGYLFYELFYFKLIYCDLKYFFKFSSQGNEIYRLVSTTVFLLVALIMTYGIATLFGFRLRFNRNMEFNNRLFGGLISGFLAGGACCLLIFTVMVLFYNVRIQLFLFDIPSLYGSVAYLVGYCLIVAIFEELIFRGLVFNTMYEKLPIFWSVILSSLVFALSHKYDFLLSGSFALRIIIGVICCVLFISSKSIWAPIAFHWIWDVFAEFLFSGQPHRPELVMMTTAVETKISTAIFLIFVLYLILKFAFTRQNMKQPVKDQITPVSY